MTSAETGTAPPPFPRPAATLIVMRERDGMAPALFMGQRSHSMAFAKGALVFPGGAVDAADFDMARSMIGEGVGITLEDAAGRVAAVRETLEEIGLLVGVDRICSADECRQMRAELLAGEMFSDILDRHGVTIDFEQLHPFARWEPPSHVARAYDTRFYVVRSSGDTEHLTPDGSETIHLVLAGAEELLGIHARNEHDMLFPTLRNLERIAQFDTIDALIDHTRQTPVEKITIRYVYEGEALYALLPEGSGYPFLRVQVDARTLPHAMLPSRE